MFYAAPMLANVKGYVWYSPASFEEWGVEVPATWDELLALTATIREKTGGPAWCAGFESEAASGWPGTDWIEDIVLRQSGPEVYDQWVANEVKFTDPEIVDAFDALDEILRNPEYVNAGFGDVESINSTAFAAVAAPVANGTCPLTHQASFLSANFLDTENAAGEVPTVAPDGDVYAFVLPGFTEGATTIEVGGEFVTAFSDDAATVAVLEYMSTPEWADERVWPRRERLGQPERRPEPGLQPVPHRGDGAAAGPEHHRALRRFRPDALHGGRRLVLEGNGRLDRRQGHGDGAERHPGRLRELGSDGRERGRSPKAGGPARGRPKDLRADCALGREPSKSPTTHSEGAHD